MTNLRWKWTRNQYLLLVDTETRQIHACVREFPDGWRWNLVTDGRTSRRSLASYHTFTQAAEEALSAVHYAG